LLFVNFVEVRASESNVNMQVTVDLMIAGLLVTSMHVGLVGLRTYTRRDAHFA